MEGLGGGAPRAVLRGFDESSLPTTIVGTDDPGRAWAAVVAWTRAHLGSAAVDCFHCVASVGLVFGVRLGDGRSAAVKAHPRGTPRATLESIQEAQRTLAASGFPAPASLARPARLLETFAVAEAWLPAPAGDFDDPSVVAASAAAFARHAALLRAEGFGPAPPTIANDPWPPQPHNALFDFSRDAEGARWIDEIAVRAQPFLDRGSTTVAHSDWSAKHVRFDGPTVAAVYDWDSLRSAAEPVLAGFAAACHWVTLDPDDPWRAEPRRVRSFLDAYDEARGARLPAAERESAEAAAVYLFAYTARCEHGFVGTRGRPVTAVRGTLAHAADELLRRA